MERELTQARLLSALGSPADLLLQARSEKHRDAVADGFITEFKTITVSIREFEQTFLSSPEKMVE
jgi:hypothetical protein